jgi:hypothetical protein
MKLIKIRTAVTAAAIGAAVWTTAGMAFAPHEAGASGLTACASRGCDLFQSGPANGYYFTAPGFSRVGMICWTDSSWYAGTNRWFYVSTIYGTGRAWVSADQVVNQTRVGHC